VGFSLAVKESAVYRSLAAVGLLAALAAFLSPAHAEDKDKKLRVVIIDGQNNHNWRATTPVLKKILEDCGRFTVDVSTSPRKKGEEKTEGSVANPVPFPPDLSKYDVLLSNYNGEAWPADFQRELEQTLSEGKIGLSIIHAANNSFTGWGEYNKMIGIGWRDSKFGERLIADESGNAKKVEKGVGPGASHGPQHAFKIAVRNTDHPITKGMPAEWMYAQDELYHGLRGPVENVTLLATAFSSKDQKGTGEHEPMILTIAYGKGRVFHTPMGHDLPAMRCWGFVGTVQRGTEWAATGQVTLDLPKDFPTADKVSQMPAK